MDNCYVLVRTHQYGIAFQPQAKRASSKICFKAELPLHACGSLVGYPKQGEGQPYCQGQPHQKGVLVQLQLGLPQHYDRQISLQGQPQQKGYLSICLLHVNTRAEAGTSNDYRLHVTSKIATKKELLLQFNIICEESLVKENINIMWCIRIMIPYNCLLFFLVSQP